MRALRHAAAWTGFFILVTGALPLAKDAANAAGTQKVPQGRPFQMLRQAITDLSAEFQAQIAELEAQVTALNGRVDAIEVRQATQDTLIGTLQAGISMLEQQLIGTQADVNALQTWRTMQDALWEQMNDRISQLQQEVDARSGEIDLLWDLQRQQQIAIGRLQEAIDFLSAQGAAQQDAIDGMQGQLEGLLGAYLATREQLSTGCPPRSSLRQLPVSGQVVCEPDSGTFFEQRQQTVSASVPPGGVPVTINAFCPPADPQWVATGGGFATISGGDVLQSRPFTTAGWMVVVRNTTLQAITFNAYVICARGLPLP